MSYFSCNLVIAGIFIYLSFLFPFLSNITFFMILTPSYFPITIDSHSALMSNIFSIFENYMPVPTTRPNFITFDKDFWGKGEILPPPLPKRNTESKRPPTLRVKLNHCKSTNEIYTQLTPFSSSFV